MAETLHMKLSREQKRKLQKLADSKRLHMSEVVRDLIDEAPLPTRGETRNGGNRTRREV